MIVYFGLFVCIFGNIFIAIIYFTSRYLILAFQEYLYKRVESFQAYFCTEVLRLKTYISIYFYKFFSMLQKLFDFVLPSGFWLKIVFIIGLLTLLVKYKSPQLIELTQSLACSQLYLNYNHQKGVHQKRRQALEHLLEDLEHYQSQLELCYTQRSNQHKVSQEYKIQLEISQQNELFWKRITGVSILFVPLASYLFWSLGKQKSKVDFKKIISLCAIAG